MHFVSKPLLTSNWLTCTLDNATSTDPSLRLGSHLTILEESSQLDSREESFDLDSGGSLFRVTRPTDTLFCPLNLVSRLYIGGGIRL